MALIDNPNRRGPMQLAGATAAFTPNHVLAAAIAVRASAKIGPRITGIQPLGNVPLRVVIFTAFLLNLFTPLALKGCAVLLKGEAIQQADATSGLVQIEKFISPLVEERYEGHLLHELPDLEGKVVVYGYGPEVVSLMSELDSRGLSTLVIED